MYRLGGSYWVISPSWAAIQHDASLSPPHPLTIYLSFISLSKLSHLSGFSTQLGLSIVCWCQKTYLLTWQMLSSGQKQKLLDQLRTKPKTCTGILKEKNSKHLREVITPPPCGSNYKMVFSSKGDSGWRNSTEAGTLRFCLLSKIHLHVTWVSRQSWGNRLRENLHLDFHL